MTRWYKPDEKLPADEEKVLVRFNDKIESAFYDSETSAFRLRDGTVLRREDDVMWMNMFDNRVEQSRER